MEKSILELYLLLSTIVGIGVAFYLFFYHTKNDNPYLSRLLGIVLLCSSSHFLRNYLISSGWIFNFPWYYGTFSFIYLLAPAVTYLYIRGLLNDEYQMKWSNLFHILPSVVQIIFCIPYITSPAEIKLKYVREITAHNNFINNTPFNGLPNKYFFAIVFLTIATYSILIWREIKKAKLNSKDDFQREIFQWARFVFFISLSMAMLMIINAIVRASEPNGNFQLTAFGPFLWLRLFLFSLVLYRIIVSQKLLWGLPNFTSDSEIITKHLSANSSTIGLNKVTTEKWESAHETKKELLSANEAAKFQLVLNQFFETQTHIFTEFDFNLADLSKSTKIPKHHWAYYFQYHSEIGFVELRNKHRIAFSKSLMQLSEFNNRTIEGIGQTAGFRSRVTFFNAFKKYESMSPSEYWDSVKKKDPQ